MYERTITDFGEQLTLIQDGVRMSIPADPDNRHYAEFMKWAADGNEETVIDSRSTQEQRDTAAAKAKILALEEGQARAIREAVLTGDKALLQDIEAQIVAERAKISG